VRHQNVKATWDEGWVGKHVNGPPSDDAPRKETTTVHDNDNDVILYGVEDGLTIAYLRKRRVGFVR
jgi:hypothetical protein